MGAGCAKTLLWIQNRRPRESGDQGKYLKARDSRLRGNDGKGVGEGPARTFHTALYGNTSVKVHPARSSPFLLVQYERSEGSPLAGAMRATTLYSVEST
jgi:hypothetical protein